MGTVLYLTVEVLRQVAILAQPVMPGAAQKLLDLLAVAPAARSFATLGGVGRLKPGTMLPKPEPVFPRYIEPEQGAGEGGGATTAKEKR
jgi:methionyl-tRNA synthetase